MKKKTNVIRGGVNDDDNDDDDGKSHINIYMYALSMPSSIRFMRCAYQIICRRSTQYIREKVTSKLVYPRCSRLSAGPSFYAYTRRVLYGLYVCRCVRCTVQIVPFPSRGQRVVVGGLGEKVVSSTVTW